MTPSKAKPFFRAETARELPGPGRRALFHLWNGAALLLSSLGITLLSLLLGLGMFSMDLFYGYFYHPMVFLLNWIPVLLFELLLYGLTGRQWLAFLIVSLVVLLASIGGYYKILFRSEPLYFSDLKLIGAAAGVLPDYTLTLNTRILAVIAFIPLGTLILFFFAKGRPALPARSVLALGSVLATGILWTAVYSSDTVYDEKVINNDHLLATRWPEMIYVTKGSVYPFLHSITDALPHPPQGYNEGEAAALLDAYTDADIPADKRVNLLVFQLESFADYSRSNLPGLAEETYALWHEIEADSLHGTLISNVVGGGTIDTERCFLTGSTHLQEYAAPARSYVRYLTGQGYEALASHPHNGHYYARKGVNEYLGFDEFWYWENHYTQIDDLEYHWMSDFFLFPEVVAQYQEHAAAGENVFSFTVTTQGHGAYETDGYDGFVYWDVPGCSDECFSAVNHYLAGLVDTQQHVAAALDALRDDPEPVVVLIYGDHRPRFVEELNFYDVSGISFDQSSDEGIRNTYATPYVIWANNAARDLYGEETFLGEGPDTSSCFFMTRLFDLLGWEGSADMQFGRQVMARIPVIHAEGFYEVDGEFVTELSAEDAELLRQYECLQYYLKYRF